MKPRLITAVGRERMQTTIKYLRALPPERFDFGGVYFEAQSQMLCGTVGCVIGHCPDVFPDLCFRDENHETQMRGEESSYSYSDFGERLYGVPSPVINDLLYPRKQSLALKGLADLGFSATPTEVADMLESFLAQVDDIPATEKARDAQ